jgi:hypothetical protein
MISDARRGHVSPGIYTEERDVTYAVKSLGITSLGLVGETLYGPAFENIEVKDWSEFVDYFGGTSPEKYKGTGLPKYELPYIAKSYLEESKRLNVVRVLGLSGYHAGPCWVLKTSSGKPLVVFRSKMEYVSGGDFCNGDTDDTPQAIVTAITKTAYTPTIYSNECVVTAATATTITDNYKFGIVVACKENGLGYKHLTTYKYNVSLNPKDSDYIYKVISSSPETGNTPIYIEAVYESSLGANDTIGSIETILAQTGMTQTATTYQWYEIVSDNGARDAYRIKRNLGMQQLPIGADANWQSQSNNVLRITGNTLYSVGDIVKVNTSEDDYPKKFMVQTSITGTTMNINKYDNYCEMYRPAQTPWFVSQAYASSERGSVKVSMKKLFKFITISDGDASNYQIKVSIQKVDPFKGTFDVIVRDFNDTDNAPIILEKFANCNLEVGSPNYIGVLIGTSDGGFAAKSKYITVELGSDDDLSGSVPCGFLGFPMPTYSTSTAGTVNVDVEYYNKFNPTVKSKKQYFGLNSELIDTDILKYKGVEFYDEYGDIDPTKLTNGFHLDSIVGRTGVEIFVDGVSGYKFDAVSEKAVTGDRFAPRIIKGEYINHTIYKDEALRKFTTYCYGGFDGWDVNRTSRTNTNEFKATNYTAVDKNNNESTVFTTLNYNGLNQELNLPETAITSDYYAYLAGYRVFANPQDVDINVLATPGIDWYNNKLLTLDVIDMVEDADDGRGGDLLYIMESPNTMSVEELAFEFEESDIDTSYACTYYPWIMFYDSFNNQYLDLPPTKDVVRNIAKTDNNSYPWFAPAGFERGNVNCVKADLKTTLVQEDVLYENRINPIKTFGKDGVKIWGNKTAYSVDSPLNRINVRRLMIRVKKLISTAARNLIFEQYSDTLEKQFKGLVEPILAEVKSNKGIYDYRVVTEVTPETRDQHILPAKILIKPTPALEYISISFVVYPESVSFED